ncbi:polyprenyl synthetase family protein [Lutibacter sp.]|uniref:polyprenyl synthetase family protein n=1 Tax=Lutibacter sp. TaxID=1925666 RepID=UPI0035670E5E
MNIVDTYKDNFLDYLNSSITIKEPENLYKPIHYILQLGGKRLRPILTLLTCDLFGGNSKQALNAALAIEVFHNFTLIHDDIMDSAPMRRGHETVHKKWNVNTGILSGDAMMIVAYQCFENYEPTMYKKLLTVFNKTALEVCEGQQLDIDFENRNNVTIAEYIKMITFKTSVLVAAAMKMGAIIAKVDDAEAAKIYNFGLNLGIAFQLQDDYLDTFGNAETFGKQIGGDILENKKTFLFLKCIEIANKSDVKELLKLYSDKKGNAQKVQRVTELFINNKIDENTIKEIESYTNKAFEILNSLTLSDEKKAVLKNFGLNLMKRTV